MTPRLKTWRKRLANIRAHKRRSSRNCCFPYVFWIFAFIAIPVWGALGQGNGWDAKVYLNAIHSVQAGHDPYADGIAVQEASHAQRKLHPLLPNPLVYVYSPLTLPLLRMIGILPLWFSIGIYWLLYGSGISAQIYVGAQFIEPKEWRFFAFFAPAAAFFPGLLQNMVLWGGNIAYILYGLVLTAALLGWRRGHWRWFYLAVLVASCFKPPLLTLLAIPVLSSRGQWLPASVTAGTGVGLFAIQSWVWPSYFHNYLCAVELQFGYNHDFGSGPAGLLGSALVMAGLTYSPWCMIFYGIITLPLFGLLFYLSRRFLRGDFTLERWVPVMVTGVILLNPRIQEYDVAPLTLFMALIFYRTCGRVFGAQRQNLFCALFFVGINILVIPARTVLVDEHVLGSFIWSDAEGLLLAGIFMAGCRNLLRQT